MIWILVYSIFTFVFAIHDATCVVFNMTLLDRMNRVKVNTSEMISYFAICAVIKDELDLHEWVSYHYRMGCGRFYLHDNSPNNSEVISASVQLSAFIEKKIVTIKNITHEKAPQLGVYHRCIRNYRLKHQFIGMIDADEFIVTRDGCSVPSVLRLYEEYGGLTLNWMMFGSSGYVKRPSGGILSNYRSCAVWDHVKIIVNTNYAISHYGNPHQFHYSDHKYAVDSDFIKMNSHVNFPRPSLYSTIYLNHYHLKSWEDFNRSRNRGRASTTEPSRKKSNTYFSRIDVMMNSTCPILSIPEQPGRFCSADLLLRPA
jgi:hypothetical protein